MTESDKKYHERLERHEQKHRLALSKAAYRGKVSEEWHIANKLTPATLPDFKKAMKQANKEWELMKGVTK